MKNSLLIIFFFLSFELLSQTNPILFSDEFDNNNNQWTTSTLLSSIASGSDFTAEISKGKYHIFARKNGQSFHRIIPISDSKDYSYEVSFIADFPFNSLDQFFYSYYGAQMGFTFYSDYTYNIYTIKNKVSTNINRGTSAAQCFPNTPAIALKRKVIMKIERQGVHTSFYINDIKLETIDNLNLPGNKAGFTVGDNSKVAIERFTIKQDNNGINITKQNNNGIKRTQLSSNVNTTVPELGPIITADGKNLYFNRRDRYDNPAAQNNECDDIWVSPLQVDSSWGLAQKLPFPINDATNNDFISLSPDNNTLFMSDKSCDPTPSIKFWTSHRTASGWSNPSPMSVINGYDLDKFTEVTLSADGKTLIVALRREETLGEPDLYVCFLGKDSVWSEPKNLGNTINTLGLDFSPFLAADGVTLYYSTDGLPGFGDEDVFMSRRLDDTWTNWSTPENLGTNVNSSYWDAYYSVNA